MPAQPPEYLNIGQILAPHGVQGEVKVSVTTDFPERFVPRLVVYLGPQHLKHTIQRVRWHRHWALLTFAGLNDRESVDPLRGLSVDVPLSEAVPLEEGRYYEHQIIGLKAWTEEGRYLGEVTEIIPTGSNDVYVLSNGGKELLIPALKSVVLEIDLDKERLLVRLMEGLE